MTGTGFTGYQCWKDERIKSVFNLDAIAIDPVNFLATHAPLDRIQYVGRSPEGLNNTGEERLLMEMQRLSRENEHALIVVEGMPGSGKSHLIRWLKEQYSRQRDLHASREVVLLIERANSSLRGTLRQIVESTELQATGIYDDRVLAEQIDRLRNAADLLSEDSLPEALLNGLREGAMAVSVPDEPGAERLLQKNAAGNMLLDQTFRAHLVRPDGPVDRLARHLNQGRAARQETGSQPEFSANDLLLNSEQARQIERAGYPEVQLLAKRLVDVERATTREQYAGFLNRRLNFAVGRATALSANDIKEIFNDLRRALRHRDYQLVLFIEDVTSFTGIDAGLIDVLATQHTGQENIGFARLVSAIGITDDYYLSRFPQNLKQRVTHHLRLSSENTSLLLEQPDSIANVTVRYLNATRLNELDLEAWAVGGGDAETLPNACNACRFKSECHASFGYVALGDRDDESHRVGLYPFNHSALQTIFHSLNSQSPTPRTLLSSAIEPVLVRHGWKIQQGEFPPPRGEFGNEFSPPTLLPTGGHERVIRNEAPRDSDRLESLFVFWGDRTATSITVDGDRTVSSLPKGVFQAFQLPFIAGVPSGVQVPLDQGRIEVPPPVDPVPPQVVPRVQQDPILQDIRSWRDGQSLQQYETLRRDLINVVRDAIDWESYQLSPLQIGDRIEARRFRIEGQAGRTQGDVHTFLRSDSLMYALQAVHALKSMGELPRADLTGHMLALRSWLDRAESEIVEFVRKPHSAAPSDLNFVEVVVADALLLGSLEGQLLADERSVKALGLILLQHGSTVYANSADQFASTWKIHFENGRSLRSREWTALRQKISPGRSQGVWRSLLGSLNRSQGGVAGVRFIDADLLLKGIEQFRANNWSLDQFAQVASLGAMTNAWDDPLKVLMDLRNSFPDAIAAERNSMTELRAQLLAALDGDSPEALIEDIRKLLAVMREHKLPQPFDRFMLSGNAVNDQLVLLNHLIEEQDPARVVIRFSKADRTLKLVQESVATFRQVEEILTRYESIISGRLQANQQRVEGLSTIEVVKAELAEATKLIDEVLKTTAAAGAKP